MAKTSKSLLSQKLGDRLKKGVAEHKDDDVVDGGERLPAGIEGGVAQLDAMEFREIPAGKTNAGKLEFYASGIVKSPEKFAGLRTFMQEPLFDTPSRSRKTIEDHLGQVIQVIKKFGVDTSEMEGDELESAAAALLENKPHFFFRTWAGEKDEIKEEGGKFVHYSRGKKQGVYRSKEELLKAKPYAERDPMVQHQWGKTTVWEENSDDGVTVEPENEIPTDEGDGAPEPDESEATAEDEAPEIPDVAEKELRAWAKKATDGDSKHQAKLSGHAKLFNIDANNIDTWEEVVDQILAQINSDNSEDASEEGGEETNGDEEESYLGKMGKYKPWILNKTTKKKERAKKALECEVLHVDGDNCTLLNTDDGKTKYENVPLTDVDFD